MGQSRLKSFETPDWKSKPSLEIKPSVRGSDGTRAWSGEVQGRPSSSLCDTERGGRTRRRELSPTSQRLEPRRQSQPDRMLHRSVVRRLPHQRLKANVDRPSAPAGEPPAHPDREVVLRTRSACLLAPHPLQHESRVSPHDSRSTRRPPSRGARPASVSPSPNSGMAIQRSQRTAKPWPSSRSGCRLPTSSSFRRIAASRRVLNDLAPGSVNPNWGLVERGFSKPRNRRRAAAAATPHAPAGAATTAHPPLPTSRRPRNPTSRPLGCRRPSRP